MIGIVNYGSGNVYAVANIYKRLNIPYFLTADPSELGKAEKLILPGVGAFDETMNLLRNSGLKSELDILVLEKKIPILGVCVGMQILAESSSEGNTPGLGWIKGRVVKIDATKLHRKPLLPHLGWNEIEPTKDHSLFKNVDVNTGYYFLHSFIVECANEKDILAKTTYGSPFACAINHDNVFGVQFHPEKSHHNGIALFENYAAL